MKSKTWIKSVRLVSFAIILTIFGVSGCTFKKAETQAATQPAGADPAKTLTYRMLGEPETLDWNKAHTPIETYLLMNLMEGLVAFDKDLNVVPALAESYKVSKDQTTYTFKLRPGIKWSDGVALKASDFVYSWKRLLSPVTAASYAYFLFDVEGAEDFNKGKTKDFSTVGVKALDESTLEVKLRNPVAFWIQIPTFWVTFPMREDVVSKYGTSWASPGRMVSLGAFTLFAHDMDSQILLKPNPTYYAKAKLKSNIEQIRALIVKDDATALNLFETGKIDFQTDISTLDLKRLSGKPDLKAFPYLKTGYLGLVTDKYPTNSPHIRRAIAMAIDRSKFPEILHGGQTPGAGWVPPKMLGHLPKGGLPFDPARAKAELKASGVDTTKPLQLEITLPSFDKAMTVAQYIQGELKKNLGIEVVLQPFDNKTFRAQIDLHAFPMYILSWSADFPDPDNFFSLFLSGSGNNRTGWKNQKYDELVFKGRKTPDKKAREKIYTDANRILLEDEAVILPLFYEPNMALVKDRVTGLEISPLNYVNFKNVVLK